MVDAKALAPNSPVDATPLPDDAKLPKLSLGILMLWLTLSAIGFVIAKWLTARAFAEGFEGVSNSMVTTLKIFSAMSVSIAVGEFIGLGALAVAWKRSSRVFLKHPGHWLVAIACVIYVLGFGSQFISRIDQYLISNYDWSETGWRIRQFCNSTWYFVAFCLIPMSLNIAAAYFYRGTWRWVFGLLAIQPVVSMALRTILQLAPAATTGLAFGGAADSVLVVSVVLMLIYAMASEVWRGVERDWVHWLGAFSLVLCQPITGGVAGLLLF